MGFWDFIKKLLPDQLIKIEDRKIIFKNSKIIIGDHAISDSKIVEKIHEEIQKYFFAYEVFSLG